jgi:hypothetical protein
MTRLKKLREQKHSHLRFVDITSETLPRETFPCHGFGRCNKNGTNVFTPIQPYINWIVAHISMKYVIDCQFPSLSQ